MDSYFSFTKVKDVNLWWSIQKDIPKDIYSQEDTVRFMSALFN